MRTTCAAFAALMLAANAFATDFRIGGRTLAVPSGFTVELVAGPPLVQHPVHATFDDRGRMLVTDVSGTNAPPSKQLQELPHRIARLTDENGDGVFDKSTLWADRLALPEGILWHEGAAYVTAPPAIWKLDAAPNDGPSASRSIWYDAKTLTGCANDLHGPWLGPDGWIYWTKGAFAEQTHKLTDGSTFKTKASMLLRRRVEGGPVDVLMTGGMDNPVGLAFLPCGERIVSGTFFHHPQNGLRDGMLHAIYGGVYGKDHPPIDGLFRTGGLMPVMTECGPAAPSALLRYEGKGFGADFADNLLLCQFNLRKVSRHVVHPDGGTFRTTDLDCLSSPDLDFHPTDVVQDADGSVLVVDTGGWYKLCCPTSQLAKPEVPGAIYRIRRTDAKKVDDPWAWKIDWAKASDAELVRLLNDERPKVAWKAVAVLAKRGARIVPLLRKEAIQDGRPAATNAVWALSRIEGPEASAALVEVLNSRISNALHVALHAASLRRDPETAIGLQRLCSTDDPAVLRATAEALGRVGKGSSNSAHDLIRGLASTPRRKLDRATRHALIYALHELDASEETVAAYAQSGGLSPELTAAMLFVASQPGPSATSKQLFKSLRVEAVMKDAESGDSDVRDAALFALSRLFVDESRGVASLKARLDGKPASDPGWKVLRPLLVSWLSRTAVRDLVADWLKSGDPAVRRHLWSVAGEFNGRRLPLAWIDPAIKAISTAESEEVTAVLALLRKFPREDSAELAAALKARASDAKLPDEIRLSLLAAAPGGEVDGALFETLLAALDPQNSIGRRSAAADVLGSAKLKLDQIKRLVGPFERCGPLEIDRLVPAFTNSRDPSAAGLLLEALAKARSRKSVRVDDLRQKLKPLGPAVDAAAQKLYRLFDEDRATERQRLEKLLRELPSGDHKRGLLVFNSSKASCRACHRLGYVGGELGPDLSRIGSIRGRRDLLESIVFPSASFVRSYEPTLLRMSDGRTISGLVRRETPEELTIAVNAQQELRLAVKDVEAREPGTVSIMPAGLDQQLSPQELADLVAFLESAK